MKKYFENFLNVIFFPWKFLVGDLLCGQTIRFGIPHFNGYIRVLFVVQFPKKYAIEKNLVS